MELFAAINVPTLIASWIGMLFFYAPIKNGLLWVWRKLPFTADTPAA